MNNITWDISNKGCAINLNDEKLIAKNNGTSNDYEGSLTNIGRNINGKYYLEIDILNLGVGSIIIGICKKEQKMCGFGTKDGFTTVKGLYNNGTKIDSGKIVSSQAKNFSNNDTISLLLDLDNKKIEFWINGKNCGILFDNLDNNDWYPCVFGDKYSSYKGRFKNFKYNYPKEYVPYDFNKYMINQKCMLYNINKIDNKYKLVVVDNINDLENTFININDIDHIDNILSLNNYNIIKI